MQVVQRHPVLPRRARSRLRSLLVRGRPRATVLVLLLLHAVHLGLVHHGGSPIRAYLRVGSHLGIHHRDILRTLVRHVRVIAGVRQVGDAGDRRVLVHLVAGGLVGRGLRGNLVRGRWAGR